MRLVRICRSARDEPLLTVYADSSFHRLAAYVSGHSDRKRGGRMSARIVVSDPTVTDEIANAIYCAGVSRKKLLVRRRRDAWHAFDSALPQVWSRDSASGTVRTEH